MYPTDFLRAEIDYRQSRLRAEAAAARLARSLKAKRPEHSPPAVTIAEAASARREMAAQEVDTVRA